MYSSVGYWAGLNSNLFMIQKLQDRLFQLKIVLEALQKNRRVQLYLAAKAAVDTDVTPVDAVPDDVACAEVVSTLINKVVSFPIIHGTYTLYTYLGSKYQLVQTPLPGDIIISPTGMASKKVFNHGHVGVVGVGGIVYSNNSLNGKLQTHYTISTWKKRYQDTGGYPVYFFRL